MKSSLFLGLAALIPVACALEQLPLTGEPRLEHEAYDAKLDADWKAMDVVDALRLAGFAEEYHVDEERLVQVFGQDSPRWITEGDKLRLKKAGFAFVDVTDNRDLGELNALRLRPQAVYKSDSSASAEVVEMLQGLDDAIEYLRKDITKLTSFWTRSYRSQWGVLSSNWVFDHVSEILSHSNLTTVISKFPHKNFKQNSVIARVQHPDAPTNESEIEVVIIGAHQDSLNYNLPFFRSPGADDDGSGTVTTMHVLRTLVKKGFTPPPNVAFEFHWYAAEEGGLLGSREVAAAYEKAGVNVKGMLQMDMTAFVRDGKPRVIGFFQDMVDENLTDFCKQLVEAYTPLPWNMTTCGPVCGSDHMSWTAAGYPSAFATEGLFEDFPRNIHTEDDSLEMPGDSGEYSFEHMVEFVKLGIAFVTELSAL